MPLSFPSSPTVGQQSTQNGRVYAWSGTAWEFYGSVNAHAANHASGGSDAVSIASTQLSDSTTTGRSLITTASASAARTTLSAAAADLVFNPFLLAGM